MIKAIVSPSFTKTGRRSKTWFAVVRIMPSGDAAAYHRRAPAGYVTPICRGSCDESAIEQAVKHATRLYRRARADEIAAEFNASQF